MKLILILAFLTLSLSACKGNNEMEKQYDMKCVLKISVLKSGEILADGNKVSLQDLDSLIADNAQKKGLVWYYREAGQAEPPPQAKQVIQIVIKYKRPISMSSKPDFSDTLDQNGKSIPRKE